MSPCLITLGFIGNSLVFIVFNKSSMRQTTCSIYLRFLAVFDSLVLCVNLVRYWIIHVTDYDLRDYSAAVCKIHTWATYWVSYTSAWLLVSVTVERCVSVWFPHKVKTFCTKRKTYIIIIAIILIMALINAHYLYGLGDKYDTEENVTYCDSIFDGHYDFETFIWPWVDLSIYSLLPSTILSVCNTSIIFKVISSNRRILRDSSVSGNSTQNGSLAFRRYQQSSLTAMLITTSIIYVVCTTPFCIFVIYSNNSTYEFLESSQEMAVDELLWAAVNMLQFTNNCINFILYCVSGRRFRAELKGLCCRQEQRRSVIYNVPPSITSNYTRETSVDL